MATISLEIDQDYMSNALETILTIPTGYKLIYLQLLVCNTDAATAYTFDLEMVPPGQTDDPKRLIWKGVSGSNDVRPGETKKISINRGLAEAGTLQCIASAASKLTRGGYARLESV